MGENTNTFQTSVWLSTEDIAWIDTRLQEIKRAGRYRAVNRSAFIRALIRAAMQRPPLTLEGVTIEEELTERLSQDAFPQVRENNER